MLNVVGDVPRNVVFSIKKKMRIKYLFLAVVLVVSNCAKDTHSEFVVGDIVLVYENLVEAEKSTEVLTIKEYTRGYEMLFLDPKTNLPFSGTIEDDHSLYRGRYSIEEGYMRELITYYEDGSPSDFGVYNQGEIEKMSSWYRDGQLKSELIGGENWIYTFYSNEGNKLIHIENSIQTEYFESGEIKSEIPFNELNQYHGTAIVYNEDGTVKAELEYQFGKLVTQVGA